MSDKVYVTALPECDVCKYDDDKPGVEAHYDGRTGTGSRPGSWAYMCERHFTSHGIGLGTGRGQRLIVGEEPERTDEDIRSDLAAALEAGDFDAAEDAIGDRDIAEFL